MKLSTRTITALGRLITGDEQLTRYRSGPQLVRLFNNFGADDTYGQGFPSRWAYAEAKLAAINGTAKLQALISEVLDPREFLDTQQSPDPALAFLNQRLAYDGYEVVIDRGLAKVRSLKGVQVEATHPFQGSDSESHIFIDEQIKKAEKKIQEEDYDGAITNARSLLEAVLTEIESSLDKAHPPYDGDLPKLYKRVQKLLKLDPSKPDLDQSLRQVLSGLISIIQGLSGLSNKLGDRHVRTYKPSRHHAVLVCNCAKSACNFLFESFAYQKKVSVLQP